MPKWVTLCDEAGDPVRVDLEATENLELYDPNWGTGIQLEAVYLMPRAKRVIVQTYSIWENPRTHGHYGRSYQIADVHTIARLARQFGNPELMELLPVMADD